LRFLNRAKPARQQDLVDHLVELGDVALKLRLVARIVLQQVDAEADARQWRAQFVRRIGEQHAVRVHQVSMRSANG
jgi:hypothetical protein